MRDLVVNKQTTVFKDFKDSLGSSGRDWQWLNQHKRSGSNKCSDEIWRRAGEESVPCHRGWSGRTALWPHYGRGHLSERSPRVSNWAIESREGPRVRIPSLLEHHFLVFSFLFLKIKVWLIYNVVPANFCCTAKRPTHTHTHTHTHFFFSYYLLSCSVARDWIEFPMLYSRTSLLIHSKCHSLYLPTPNSWSIPISILPSPGAP